MQGTTLIQGGAMMHLVCVDSDNEGVNEMFTVGFVKIGGNDL